MFKCSCCNNIIILLFVKCNRRVRSQLFLSQLPIIDMKIKSNHIIFVVKTGSYISNQYNNTLGVKIYK